MGSGAAHAPVDGERLAAAGNDRLVRVWRTADGSLLASLTGHTDRVRSVAFSPNGNLLASAGFDRRLILWDAVMNTGPLRQVRGGENFRAVAFSPNSRWLADSRQDASLFLAHNPALTPTLKFEGARLTEAGFAAQVRVQPDWPVTLQVSGDLRTWQTLTNRVPDSTVLPVLDPEARQQAQRFYRAVR